MHIPEQNGIIERANKIMRESLAPVILTDYEQARSEISRIIQYYNNNRRHSSLNYLTPTQYYRGNHDVLLAVVEARSEKVKLLKWENNMMKKKWGMKRQGPYHNSFCDLSRTVRNSTIDWRRNKTLCRQPALSSWRWIPPW